MLKIENLSKYFGSQQIFDNVNFIINPGEKVGLAGRNGHGKTTLLRIITGEESPTEGTISCPKGYRIGYVTQNLELKESTVLREGMRGLREEESEAAWKVEKILSGLGFTEEEINSDPALLSGGFQVRLNLCRVLVSEPDMLLLDEPTNYLDITSIRWLKNFLRQWKGELILITHDRSFMDGIITHTMGIHRQRIRKIQGDTGKLYEQILKEEEIHEKTRQNDEKKQKEAELFISRFRAKARLAGMVQSRIKALEKKEKLNKLDQVKNLEFSFNYAPFNAKTICTISDLSFSYENNQRLISELCLNISRDDRICIIGKNGKGKSTLLKLFASELSPAEGNINFHAKANTGYFAQTNIHTLNPALTIEEELLKEGCDRQTARDTAGAMLFQGDNAIKKISVLSGGEKSRVLLGKILISPRNLILLDEPTNHLDMESCDALMAAINQFQGAVVMVTHNELFLHELANRFIVFQGERPFLFEGSYNDFLEKIGWENECMEDKADLSKTENRLSNRKEIRKIRADIHKERLAELKPIEERMDKIEKTLELKEKESDRFKSELCEASGKGEGGRISELSKLLHMVTQEIEELYDTLESLTSTHEKRSEFYESRLMELAID